MRSDIIEKNIYMYEPRFRLIRTVLNPIRFAEQRSRLFNVSNKGEEKIAIFWH